MPLWRASTAPATEPDAIAPVHPEEGTAALEFIAVGLLLLVPIVYLVITLGTIQGQSLGVEAGARHIARAVAWLASPLSAHCQGAVLDVDGGQTRTL